MWSIRVINKPEIEPVSVDDAKHHLRVEHALDDTMISGLIEAARQRAEQYLQRTLITTRLELALPCFGKEVMLRKAPVQSTVSVKYIDTDGVEQTLAPSEYRLCNKQEPARLLPAFGKEWPTTTTADESVIIQYDAGYGDERSDIPAAIRTWILLQVATLYEKRSVESGKALDQKYSDHIDGLLDAYRIIEV